MAKRDPMVNFLVGILLWPGFIAVVLTVIFGYQLLVWLGGLLFVGVATYLVRRQRGKALARDIPEPIGGTLPELGELSNTYLPMAPGSVIRVVGYSNLRENYDRLAELFEVEDEGLLLVDGHLFAHRSSGNLTSVSVLAQGLLLGRVPKIDMDEIGEKVLRMGGSSRVKIRMNIKKSGEARMVEVVSTTDSLPGDA